MRGGRHGPRRQLLADLDAAIGFGVHDSSLPPSRGAFGEFEVTCAIPALARGAVLVGDVAAGAGASVAVPSVYVTHLEGCLRRVGEARTAGDVRRLPWPYSPLTEAVDDALRRDGAGWEALGRLEDDHPLWPGWADALVGRRGFRVATPWVTGVGAIGYGRWLPADLVEHAVIRDDGVRALELDADRMVAALRWHGLQASRADDRLAALLVGWTARLPGPAVSDCAARPTEVVLLPPDRLPLRPSAPLDERDSATLDGRENAPSGKRESAPLELRDSG